MSLIETLEQLYHKEFFWEVVCIGMFVLLYLVYYVKFRRPHFLIKGVYDVKKKNLRKPLPPFPNGWYNVAFANELAPDTVKAVDINGHNIVIFRSKNKKVHALQGYCLHMGAHLGIGG